MPTTGQPPRFPGHPPVICVAAAEGRRARQETALGLETFSTRLIVKRDKQRLQVIDSSRRIPTLEH